MNFSLGAEPGLEFDLYQMRTCTEKQENTSKEVSTQETKNNIKHMFYIEKYNPNQIMERYAGNLPDPFPLLPFSAPGSLFSASNRHLPCPRIAPQAI